MPITSDDAPVDVGRYMWLQANGKHDPAESVPLPYEGGAHSTQGIHHGAFQ